MFVGDVVAARVPGRLTGAGEVADVLTRPAAGQTTASSRDAGHLGGNNGTVTTDLRDNLAGNWAMGASPIVLLFTT